jgi:hypothetical protein
MALPVYGGGTLGGAPQKRQPWEILMGQDALPGSGPTAPPTGPTPPPTPGPTPFPRPGFGGLLDKLTPPGTNPNDPNPFGTPNIPKPSETGPITPASQLVNLYKPNMPETGSTFTPAAAPSMIAGGGLIGPGNTLQTGTSSTPAAAPAMVAGGKLIGPGNTPTPVAPPPPPTPTSLEDYKSGPLSDAGRLYEDYVTKGLKTGQFGELDAARGAYDRDSALRTTQASESAKQAALRAGAAPGSSLWQAIMNQSMGGANRANLEQGNSVNALGRDLIQKALDRAAGIETQTYNRADTERAFKFGREDLAYERRKGEEAIAKGDQNGFLNSIEDTAVRSWAASQFAQGKSLQEISKAIWTQDPTTGRTVYNPQLASLSPGKQNAANILDYLRSLGMSDAEAQATAQDIAKNQVNPITTGRQAADFQAAKTKAETQGLASLTPDERTTFLNGLPVTNSGSIAPGEPAMRSFAQENPFIKIGGKVYRTGAVTVHTPGKVMPTPFLEVTGENGERFWIVTHPETNQIKIARYILGKDGTINETKRWQSSLEDF